MKNLIPEDKRSYFKLSFHIMVLSILVSLLLVTMNNHTEAERRKDEVYREKMNTLDSLICITQKDIAYLKAKHDLENVHK